MTHRTSSHYSAVTKDFKYCPLGLKFPSHFYSSSSTPFSSKMQCRYLQESSPTLYPPSWSQMASIQGPMASWGHIYCPYHSFSELHIDEYAPGANKNYGRVQGILLLQQHKTKSAELYDYCNTAQNFRMVSSHKSMALIVLSKKQLIFFF